MLKDSYSFGLSLLILFYAFFPFRIEKGFVFQIQAEVLIVTAILAWIGCTVILIKEERIFIYENRKQEVARQDLHINSK